MTDEEVKIIALRLARYKQELFDRRERHEPETQHGNYMIGVAMARHEAVKDLAKSLGLRMIE